MQLVRLLNIRYYDSALGRFTSQAFRKYRQGISVIREDCIIAGGQSLCEHIQEFYASTAGDPPIFWTFASDDLPESAQLVQETSESGDDCHYDIRGMTSGEEKRFFRNYQDQFDRFRICRDDGTVGVPAKQDLDHLAANLN